MGVNRCVCHNVSFADLIALSRREGLSLQQLAERTGATTGCGSCGPYVRIALATGRCELPPMGAAELERAIESIESRGRMTTHK